MTLSPTMLQMFSKFSSSFLHINSRPENNNYRRHPTNGKLLKHNYRQPFDSVTTPDTPPPGGLVSRDFPLPRCSLYPWRVRASKRILLVVIRNVDLELSLADLGWKDVCGWSWYVRCRYISFNLYVSTLACVSILVC